MELEWQAGGSMQQGFTPGYLAPVVFSYKHVLARVDFACSPEFAVGNFALQCVHFRAVP